MSAPSRPDVTAIITAHAEGPLVGLSLRSMLDAVDHARAAGATVELLAVLDNPDAATREAFAEAAGHGFRLVETSYADQGRVRNEAVGEATGEHVAFLDGDDLWSENWLTDALAVCRTDPGRVIAHPELDWIFDGSSMLAFFPDQLDPAFEPASLRVANAWDALCVAPIEAYRDHPFSRRAIADGYAFEDWHWNMETLASGYVHRLVPETVHFKRRRAGSQFTQARANRSLPRATDLLSYAWWAEHEGTNRIDG